MSISGSDSENLPPAIVDGGRRRRSRSSSPASRSSPVSHSSRSPRSFHSRNSGNSRDSGDSDRAANTVSLGDAGAANPNLDPNLDLDLYYSNVMIKMSVFSADIQKAIRIVAHYIYQHKCLLVGGISVDYALKSKKHSGIYDEKFELPDYDFYSSKFHEDALNIAKKLYLSGLRGISIINAKHPTTLRVRVNFVEVADITYVPQSIIDAIPTIGYRGFVIVHPHYQMIDQHSSLCHPFDNPPNEVVLRRWEKDIKRYNLLYSYYPLRKLTSSNSVQVRDTAFVPLRFVAGNCISGFPGLIYWLTLAENYGFKHTFYGRLEFTESGINANLPQDSHGFTIYADNFLELYRATVKDNQGSGSGSSKDLRLYERFLDKLPCKFMIGNDIEILQNVKCISAHKIIVPEKLMPTYKGVYVANLQHIMLYLLCNYIIFRKMYEEDRGFSFFQGYLLCTNLVEWASFKFYRGDATPLEKLVCKQFLPSVETYGKKNLVDSDILSEIRFRVKNKELNKDVLKNFEQPFNMYDREIVNVGCRKKFYSFVPQSLPYRISGERQEQFDLDVELVESIE